MIELEGQHFVVPSKLMGLSIVTQWLLISQRDRDRESDIKCLLAEEHNTTYEVVMTKK